MDSAYLPVAKRTRSGYTKILVELAAKIPSTTRDPASPIEIIDLSDDDDKVPTNNNKGAVSKLRKCEKNVGNVDRVVNDDGHEKEGMDVDSEWFDSTSTESDDDDTYRDDEKEFMRMGKKKNVKSKGKEKMVEGGRSRNKIDYKKKQKNVENKLKRNADTPERVYSRKDGQRIPEAEKVVDFHSFPDQFEDGSRGMVHKDAGGRKKNLTIGTARRNAYKNLDHLKILGESLNDKVEGLEKYVKNKFRFGEEDKKPVEKSEFEKVLDICWEQVDMYLYGSEGDEEIVSTQPVSILFSIYELHSRYHFIPYTKINFLRTLEMHVYVCIYDVYNMNSSNSY